MLWTIAIVLLLLWAVGFISGAVLGGFLHILLVVAVIMVIIKLVGGRRKL